MLEAEIRVVNPLGLHARAAAQLVRVSGRFKSRLIIRKASAEADARSMLDVLTLAASVGSVLTLVAEGVDESEAVESVKELFASGFGEI